MDFRVFLSHMSLANDVLEYGLWRLSKGPESELETLLQQAAFRAGQLFEVSGFSTVAVEAALTEALIKRCSNMALSYEPYLSPMLHQFQQGFREAYMDRYFLSRKCWLDNQPG
jgi:hypothetical protein